MRSQLLGVVLAGFGVLEGPGWGLGAASFAGPFFVLGEFPAAVGDLLRVPWKMCFCKVLQRFCRISLKHVQNFCR